MNQLPEHLLIHFVAPLEGGPIKTTPVIGEGGMVIRAGGEFAVACQPHRKDFGSPTFSLKGRYTGPGSHIRATGVPEVVTCPRCRATELYRRHSGPGGLQASGPVPGTILGAKTG